MFVRAYLDTAAEILSEYQGAEPLPAFLKKYFARFKKFGSRDRRQISHLCYCYFRLGHALREAPVQERLLAGLFLSSATPQPILAQVKPEWSEQVEEPLEKKLEILVKTMGLEPGEVFPFAGHLSAAIDANGFARSFFSQPDTYLRVRPGKRAKVSGQLEEAGIEYRVEGADCIAVPPAAKLDELLMLNRDVVVQDKSSQQVLSLVQGLMPDRKTAFSAWDCCAASGGKSILLHDLFPNARLTVSDIRSSIIVNLKKRFEQAGIRDFHAFVGDLSAPGFSFNQSFDLVLCDAPCSGSGTWGRTPEQLYFFTEEKIHPYSALQKKIATRAAKQVKRGGLFLYITCSVFREENEEVVDLLTQERGLSLQQQQYFAGYDQKADTLFAAVFTRL